MDDALLAHEATVQPKDADKRGHPNSPVFPFLHDDVDSTEDEETTEEDDDNNDDDTDSHLASFLTWPKLSLSSPSWSPAISRPSPTMKITMPFMRAYKAMRGPRDVEPSPLFSCLRGRPGGMEEGYVGDGGPDLCALADCDEARLLKQVNKSLVADDDDDGSDGGDPYSYRRRLQALSDDDTSDDGDGAMRGRRRDVFFFKALVAPPLVPVEQRCRPRRPNSSSSDRSCVSCSSCSGCSVLTDYVLDGARLDEGWLATGSNAYVSDDDGPPADTRLTPAAFRFLAAGCTRNDVDALRQQQQQPNPSSSLRFRTPRTPPNKRRIVEDSIADDEDGRLNNVRPYRNRRQFDVHTGEELSPLYRVERGSSGGGGGGPLVWSPLGVPVERAGYVLRERRQWSSSGGGSGGGGDADWPLLFQRMAPGACQELRARLYGDGDGATDRSPEDDHSSSDTTSSDDANKQRNRIVTYGWSDVNDAIQSCAVQPLHGPQGRSDKAGDEQGERGEDEQAAAAVLLALHDGWQAVATAEAENARLAAAHAQAEAVLTAQARCLARLEHVRAREKNTQGSPPVRSPKPPKRQQQIARAVRQQLQELRIRVREAEAQVAQGWERQRVLAQRVQQGEARLAREAAAAALPDELADELAQLGVAVWAA